MLFLHFGYLMPFCFSLAVVNCESMIETNYLGADTVISHVKCGNITASYSDGTVPVGDSLDSPYAFSQNRVVKGRDVIVSVTVPEDALELYISIANPHA
jgi:hypothetical protein